MRSRQCLITSLAKPDDESILILLIPSSKSCLRHFITVIACYSNGRLIILLSMVALDISTSSFPRYHTPRKAGNDDELLTATNVNYVVCLVNRLQHDLNATSLPGLPTHFPCNVGI